MTHVVRDPKIMGDEKICQAVFFLQLLQEIDYLRLH